MKQHNINSTLRVVVRQDEDAESPADFDSLGTITYSNRARHTLGSRAVNLEEHERIGREIEKGNLIGMPVFAYIHSGVAIQAAEANPFHCQWDSGRSGWVYTEPEKACQWFGWKRMSKQRMEKVLDVLKAEVQTLSQYLNGEVYRFEVQVFGEGRWSYMEGCCGGYYNEDEAMAEGILAAQALNEEVA